MTCDNDDEIIIPLRRGSDILHEVPFRDDNGDPINMTGWTLSVFEGDTWGLANATFTWVAQSTGDAVLRADWTSSTPPETWVRLRITRTADGYDRVDGDFFGPPR